jgi:hypothetical protein
LGYKDGIACLNVILTQIIKEINMSMLTKAYDGAVRGYNNLLTPSPRLEGALARCGGVSLAMFVAGTALGYFHNDAKHSATIACAVGFAIGAIKGTEGGIRFYQEPVYLNHIFNEAYSKVIFLAAGGISSQIVVGIASRSPIHVGAVALVATHIGAVAAGALKQIIEQ